MPRGPSLSHATRPAIPCGSRAATALPLDSVVAYQGWLYCNAPGRLRFAVNLRWREADLRRDPCTEPPAPARAGGVATVKHLRQWLVSHYASLIVMDSTLKTVSGPKGRRGKREIEEALVIAERDGVAALRSRLVGYEGVLSRRELGNIAQHATKP